MASKFRLHLSTCIALMVLAALYICANVVVYQFGGERVRGFPCPYSGESSWTNRYGTLCLLANLLLGVAVLTTSAIGIEKLIAIQKLDSVERRNRFIEWGVVAISSLAYIGIHYILYWYFF